MIINSMASGAVAYNWTAERVQQRLVEVDRHIRKDKKHLALWIRARPGHFWLTLNVLSQ
jgi:hypothetical protein